MNCIRCAKEIVGNIKASPIAKALSMDICVGCWFQMLYGNDQTPLPNTAILGEDGKVLGTQLPEGQGGLTLEQVKADSDIADAIYRKHANTLDHSNSLDHSNATDHANTLDHSNTHDSSPHAPSNAQKNSDISKAEIEAKLTGEISSHTHAGGSGESEVIVVKVGDTANATTTYADATGLTFTASANKEYIVEGWIRYATSATTVGLKLSCNCSTAASFVSSVFNSALVTSGMSGGGGNAFNTGAATASSFAATDNLAMVNILHKQGASNGTFTIRFAAETTGTITVKDGSVLRYRQVN